MSSSGERAARVFAFVLAGARRSSSYPTVAQLPREGAAEYELRRRSGIVLAHSVRGDDQRCACCTALRGKARTPRGVPQVSASPTRTACPRAAASTRARRRTARTTPRMKITCVSSTARSLCDARGPGWCGLRRFTRYMRRAANCNPSRSPWHLDALRGVPERLRLRRGAVLFSGLGDLQLVRGGGLPPSLVPPPVMNAARGGAAETRHQSNSSATRCPSSATGCAWRNRRACRVRSAAWTLSAIRPGARPRVGLGLPLPSAP